MRLAPELRDQIVEHARREAPKECCGVIGTRDGEAFSVVPTRNTEASALRFDVHPGDLMRAWDSFVDAGGDLGGIYHSHTRSDPVPSQTDVNYATNPLLAGVEWLIVGTAGEEPVVRSYLVSDGTVTEVELT